MKRNLVVGLLFAVSACILIYAAATHREERSFRNPVAYAFAGNALYVLEKEKNTLLELHLATSPQSLTALGAHEIEPDDTEFYYVVRRLYPGPGGLVVHSYIYRRATREFLGYRFSLYTSFDHPPRSLLTVILKNPRDYPEIAYAFDTEGNHYFVNNCEGHYNIWRLPSFGEAVVEGDTVPEAVQIMGTKNSHLDQWEAIALGPDGMVYVSSGATGKVVAYSSKGIMIREIGTVGFNEGELLAPREVFFARMSREEPPYLTVASRGNRTWVQFDPHGAPVRVFQPLKAGYPFADILVGRFQSDLEEGRKHGFDLANRALVVLDERYSAIGSYVVSKPVRTFTLVLASMIPAGLAISLSRVTALIARVRVPFFFRLLVLFIPLLALSSKIVGNSVNRITREEVNTESLRRSANLAQAVANSLSLDELQALQAPGDRESPTYEAIHRTISRLVDGQRVEQTPKWILHKIREGHYYFGVNIWRGAIFEPFVVSRERAMFFRILQEKVPRHGRFVDDQGEWFSYIHPILDRGENVIYVLELYRPAEELERGQMQASVKVNQVVAVTAIIATVLVLVFSYLFTRPLRRLMQGTEIIRRGDFDFHVRVDSRDELGDLAKAFNRMAVDLKSYTRELARTTAENENIQNELRLARHLQQGMLPRGFPPLPGADHVTMYAEMEPAREVGGDYYDFFLVDDSHLGVVVADVSGKGVPAGLFMMRIRAMLRGSAVGNTSPADILTRINQLVAPENPSAMFATLFYLICDMDTGQITYCNAGLSPPILMKNCSAALVGTDTGLGKGPPIGVLEDARYTDASLLLSPEDTLVVYTDGVTESCSGAGEFFGEDRLLDLSASLPGAGPKEICRSILGEVKTHQGEAAQFDDITVLVFQLCHGHDEATEDRPAARINRQRQAGTW